MTNLKLQTNEQKRASEEMLRISGEGGLGCVWGAGGLVREEVLPEEIKEFGLEHETDGRSVRGGGKVSERVVW